MPEGEMLFPLAFYSISWYIKYQNVLLSMLRYDDIICLIRRYCHKVLIFYGEQHESFCNRSQRPARA